MIPCVQRLQVKNFRCFSSATFDLNAHAVVIQGANGSGKTSLLEALHYACYLKSFRTHVPRDLIAFEGDNFFINTTCNEHSISIGSTGSKKQVKIDQKPISSYKELRQYYRAVTVTEDDLLLIKGSPEKRRSFLDYAIALQDPVFTDLCRTFKQVLDQRNALLQRLHSNSEEFVIWTQKLWETTRALQEKRKAFLEHLTVYVQHMSKDYWPEYEYTITYQERLIRNDQDFKTFFAQNNDLFVKERLHRRSLFGAHLDDLDITLGGKKARLFSSRGQQKLIVLLLKIAQIHYLLSSYSPAHIVFLLDDFMTDFDGRVIKKLMQVLLNLNIQLIFASPIENGPELIFLEDNNISSLKVSI